MKYYNHITLVGDTNTGKSSFVKKLLRNNLLNNYNDHQVVEFVEYSVYDDISCNTFTNYFWDVPGNNSMVFHHLEKTECVMLFCDYSKLDTLESAIEWLDIIDKDKLCYLIITKIDLEEDEGFYDLLGNNRNKFKNMFTISLKNMELNAIPLDKIMLTINNDILDRKN